MVAGCSCSLSLIYVCLFADERFEYARKLKLCMGALRSAGERLGRYSLAKRQAVQQEDFMTAKLRKEQIEIYRNSVFEQLQIEVLLEPNGVSQVIIRHLLRCVHSGLSNFPGVCPERCCVRVVCTEASIAVTAEFAGCGQHIDHRVHVCLAHPQPEKHSSRKFGQRKPIDAVATDRACDKQP